MKEILPTHVGIKASGGIKTAEQALSMAMMGSTNVLGVGCVHACVDVREVWYQARAMRLTLPGALFGQHHPPGLMLGHH